MRSGDDSAYEELYRRHADAVRRYARSCCRDAHTADDLTGEVFARTLQAVRGGSGPDSSVRAYLLTTVRRVAAAWGRTAKREQLVEDFAAFAVTAAGTTLDDDTLDLGADVRAMHEAEQSMAVRAFRSLPERYQTVLWHTTIEEESPSEVAPLLGLSANATAVLAHRAREGLKQAYLQAHVSRSLTAEGDCARYADRLGAYARGGLRMRAERGLRKHLEDCARCRTAASEVADVNEHIRVVLPVAVIGWFAAGYAVKGAAAVVGVGSAGAAAGAGAAAAAGGAGAGAAGGAGAGASAGTGAAAGAGGGTGASGAAGAGAAGGTGGAGAAVGEGLGAPAKVAIGAGLVIVVGAALALALIGDPQPSPRTQAKQPGAASVAPPPPDSEPPERAPEQPPPAPAPASPKPTPGPTASSRPEPTPTPTPSPTPTPAPTKTSPTPAPEPPHTPAPADPPAHSPRPTPTPPAPAPSPYQINKLTWDLVGDGTKPEVRMADSSWLWQRQGMSIGGRTFRHGVTVHAPSSVTIDLNRQCTAYDAFAGVDDMGLGLGALRFSVYADGQRLWRSGVVRGGQPVVPVHVPLRGHRTLRLVVEPGSSHTVMFLGDWAQSQITCR
ncbi:sigma-70 family RNA polymerase sigma factor [Streptomyces sp. NPDC045369]|uniref:sigma-70 family RNA polymerase sigma factor n=1 Tax=Streptomyces sp. NPDC045369 TaxID=3155732 RepID=UPI0033E67147